MFVAYDYSLQHIGYDIPSPSAPRRWGPRLRALSLKHHRLKERAPGLERDKLAPGPALEPEEQAASTAASLAMAYYIMTGRDPFRQSLQQPPQQPRSGYRRYTNKEF